MKHISFPLVADVVFYTVCAFLPAVGIMRFYRLPAAVVFSAATCIALAVGATAFAVMYTRREKTVVGKAAKKRRDDLMLHLALERRDRVCEALARALTADGTEATAAEDAVASGGELFLPAFTMQPLSADAIAALLRKYGEEKFTVVCNELTPEAEKLARAFGKNILGGDGVFALFERTGTTPEKLILADLPRPKLRARLRRSFSKRNSKPFFVSGCLLLIMSLFTLFPRYYLIAGCALLLLAIGVRLFGCPDHAVGK